MRTLRSPAKRYQVWLSQTGFCGICGEHIECDAPYDIDHIKPYSKGGKTILANLQLTCPSCNRSKGNSYEHESIPAPPPNK